MSNAVMLTAIPNGIAKFDASTGATTASLSVFVTPQVAGASLASVAALKNWPLTVQGRTFAVRFANDNGPLAIAKLDDRYATNRFDSTLWNTIFFPQSQGPSVKPWAIKDFSNNGVLSYRAKHVSEAMKSTYGSVAAQTTRPVLTNATQNELTTRTQGVASVLGKAPKVLDGVRANRVAFPTQAALSKPVADAMAQQNTLTNDERTNEFLRAAASHNRNNYRGLQAASGPAPVAAPDFHEIIGHLTDHPAILRRLGLIIDLVVDLPPKTLVDGNLSLFVSVYDPVTKAFVDQLVDVQVTHPWTFSVVHPYGSAKGPMAFRPYYGDADIPEGQTKAPVDHPLIGTEGLVCVDDPNAVHIDDLDVDHAAVHFSQFAEKATDDFSANGGADLPVTLPALRTAGLAVHHVDREHQVGLRFQNTASWNPNGTGFTAESLIRGYRVDVRPQGGAWTSLCLRQTTFTFANGAAPITVPAPDEGYVKASVMSKATAEDIHNVNESLFHWDGWSLVAARPGLSVGTIGPAQEGPVVPTSTSGALNLPFATKVVAQPGSLTRLRFGTSYQMRIRAVDLCGNDMNGAAALGSADRVSAPRVFKRYEPVAPPVLQMRKAVTEGESIEHLVIRSDPWGPQALDAAGWAAQNNVAPPGSSSDAPPTMGMNPYSATCERHIAPPKTSVQIAEYHGAIDRAVANVAPGQARATAAWSIVSKEEGTFHDKQVTDSTTGQYRTYQQPGRAIVTPPSALPDIALAAASGQPTFAGTDDVTPRGSALQPGQYVVFDTDTVMVPYLPDPNATGIAIQGLGAAPVFRTFGARATNASGGAWPELSTFRLVLNAAPVNAQGEGNVAFGGLNASPSSASGVTTISLPPATTLDVTYSSTVDDPTTHAFGPASAQDTNHPVAQKGLLPALSPSRGITLVHAVQRPKPAPMSAGDIIGVQRNAGETSQTVKGILRVHGASAGRLDVVASWDEYVDAPSGTTPELDPSANPIKHAGAIATVTPNVGDSVITNFQARQQFGDTKRRDITFSTVATTRFREYFPPSITSDATNITTSSASPVQFICKSSARPPAPKVLYAVPSFTFTPSTNGSTSSRTRSGGMVRVYVDRGWFASGADERLGVVLAKSDADQKTIPNLVSVWGQDPIWTSKTLKSLDTTRILPQGLAEIAYDVPLAEGLGNVNVATYKPSFNAARGLWYFDIALSTADLPDQAYFPFLRLALVRYQPQSVGTLHMSPVVCTEFVQLSADRTASVVDIGGGKYNVSLTGPTASNISGAASSPLQAASGHHVTAEFQQATTAVPDPIDWTLMGTSVVLNPTSTSGSTIVTYQATMTFPASSAVFGSKRRILFREYEVFRADSQDTVREGVGVVQVGFAPTSYKTRLVYADAIAIQA